MKYGILLGIKVYLMELDVKVSTKGLAKQLVTVALLTTETEVAMDCLYTVAKGEHHAEKAYRVCPARQSHEVRSVCKQVVFGYVLAYLF